MHQEKSPKFCLLLKHDKKDIVVRLLGHLSILIPSFKYAMSVDMPAKVSTALIDKCIHNLRNEKSFKAKLFVYMMPRVIKCTKCLIPWAPRPTMNNSGNSHHLT